MTMFNERLNKKELLDDFSLNDDELRTNLDEMEILNQWIGSKNLLIHALDQIQNKYTSYFSQHPITLGDLGCGNGDLLRAIDQWSKAKNINIKLIGIDANPFVTQYAIQKSQRYQIEYLTKDILSPQFLQHQFDIVSLNSICHHFDNETLIHLLQKLIKQTRVAIIINDLQRHWLSYYSIKLISKIFNFSYLAKHDAPLSVLRAFQRKDLIYLLNQAGITSFDLNWSWAFRWKLIIWCGDNI